MRLLAAALFLCATACRPQNVEPVGISTPQTAPPPTASAPAAKEDAGAALPAKVHRECELLIDAFARAQANDPDRPVRRILDAVLDDPPPMPLDRLEWCKKELRRLVEH